jgi:hypothetical protein
MLEWCGGRFDPDAFDIDELNEYLPTARCSVAGTTTRRTCAARGAVHEPGDGTTGR